MIKEQDLIDLGFKRNDVTAKESGQPRDWYYYDYDFKGGLSLISCDNEEAKDECWYVDIFDYEDIRFENKEDLKQLIDLINKAMIN